MLGRTLTTDQLGDLIAGCDLGLAGQAAEPLVQVTGMRKLTSRVLA